jgi:hypothetical protein
MTPLQARDLRNHRASRKIPARAVAAAGDKEPDVRAERSAQARKPSILRLTPRGNDDCGQSHADPKANPEVGIRFETLMSVRIRRILGKRNALLSP